MRIGYWIGALSLILWASGAAADDKAREAELRKRAEAYWAAWKINDRQTAYNMETAAHKGQMSPDQYLSPAGPRMRIIGYSLRNIGVKGDNASLIVELTLTLPELEGKTFSAPPVLENWTFINGEWFHGGLGVVPNPSTSPTPTGSKTDKP